MAVTKIHSIKTTLKKAIDYICNGDKTDDEIYVLPTFAAEKMLIKSLNLQRDNLTRGQRL